MSEEPLSELAQVVLASGLVERGSRGVCLISGGPDSACLAAALAVVLGGDNVLAVHLNYRLREDSAQDEATARQLCERLGVELAVERPRLAGGNVQAAARDARYRAAERLRAKNEATFIATGHTRTDLAETVIYRLAASPGRRALLGLPARRGRIVRPLLAISRERARALAGAAALPFRDDPSNLDPRFSRVRIRTEVLPVLRELNPAAEENIAETIGELAEESGALESMAADALEAAGAGAGAVAVRAEELEKLSVPLRRLALRLLAERALGCPVRVAPGQASEILRLAKRAEGGELELEGGLRASCEAGMVRFLVRRSQPEKAVALSVPGSCRLGEWEVRAELRGGELAPRGPDVATLDAAALGGELEVRFWREGDRMRPLGLGGTKTLSDLFTDQGVPRSLRRVLPLVTSKGRIAWVAGVAVSEEFRLGPSTEQAILLSARVTE